MQAHLKKTVAMLSIAGALVGGTSAYAASTGSSATTTPTTTTATAPSCDHRHPLDRHDHDPVDGHPLHDDGAPVGHRALGRRLPRHVGARPVGAKRPLETTGGRFCVPASETAPPTRGATRASTCPDRSCSSLCACSPAQRAAAREHAARLDRCGPEGSEGAARERLRDGARARVGVRARRQGPALGHDVGSHRAPRRRRLPDPEGRSEAGQGDLGPAGPARPRLARRHALRRLDRTGRRVQRASRARASRRARGSSPSPPGHGWNQNLVLAPNGRLIMSIASACDHCTTTSRWSASIVSFDARRHARDDLRLPRARGLRARLLSRARARCSPA